jgi:hypothetical protein
MWWYTPGKELTPSLALPSHNRRFSTLPSARRRYSKLL